MRLSRPRRSPVRALACGSLLGAALALACGPPPFVVHVSFPGQVELESGAPVVYQGVAIGEVGDVSLRQDAPGRRALVTVTLEIDDPAVVLRKGDRFQLSSLRGVPVVVIAPAPQEAPPLASGAVVAGEPPLVTRMVDTLGEAIETIGQVAAEAIEEAIEEIQAQEAEAPPDPAPPGPPGP